MGGNTSTNSFCYAGFWPRFAAFLIDSIIQFFMGFVLALLFIFLFLKGFDAEQAAPNPEREAILNLLGFLIGWLYFTLMESSRYQGTIGKRLLGLRVVDMQGEPVSFVRATGRHFAKFLSALILMIGFLMVGFTSRKQGLHDKIAGCLVIKDENDVE